MTRTGNVKQRELMLFYKRMASMSAAGHGAKDSLRALSGVSGKSRMGKLIRSINQEVEQGVPAGEAMKNSLRHLSGLPESALDRSGKEMAELYRTIAGHVEREQALSGALMGLTIYPAAICTVVTVLVAMILIFVVPVFKEMFASMGGVLPLPTRLLVFASDTIGIAILPLVLGLIVALVVLKVNRRLRYLLMDKTPFIGKAMRKVAAAEFMENYSAMSEAGLSQDELLVSSVSAVTNDYLSEALRQMADKARDLGSLVMEMKKNRLLEGFVVEMIESGTATGTIESACREAAPVLFDEAELANRRFVGIATPLMLITLGAIVGFIVISMYLPIFSIFTHI